MRKSYLTCKKANFSIIKQTKVQLTVVAIPRRDASPPNGVATTTRVSGPTEATVTWVARTVTVVGVSDTCAKLTGPGTVFVNTSYLIFTII